MPLKSLVLCSALMLAGMNSWAAGNFVSLTGDVRVEASGKATATAAGSQRVEAGTTVHTGNNGNAVLRLDDGQQVALSPNTSFKIDQFRFDNAKPEQNNVTMSLFKGALRVLTGLIGQRDHSKFALKTPTATIGIRGTDFMLMLNAAPGAASPASFLQVIQGGVAATNAAGTAAFAAGTTATVTSATALASGIAASALPASVASAFSSLGSLGLSAAGAGAAGAGGGASGAGAGGAGAAGGGAGAAGAGAAAAGGVGAVGVTAGVVAAAAVVAATQTTSTGTTGTQ